MTNHSIININKLQNTLTKCGTGESIVTDISTAEMKLLIGLNHFDSDDAYLRLKKQFEQDNVAEDYPIIFPIQDTADMYPVYERLLIKPNVADDILTWYLHNQRVLYWKDKMERAGEAELTNAEATVWEVEFLRDYHLSIATAENAFDCVKIRVLEQRAK